ncbi:MAG: O-phospho-L-seryl-tRNA:Cys-tRNA synthase [Candidatus Altiarchaeales archaeon]|nr:O-phospho-L-seryl-tRNA:Cys-tRNA synthase [Candidatus Altiarchaeales archaeon]MBD3416111.1 O-phospho-L-seryl-tRNA:Cys-tRNA synthase [Candidatus Altiarchaeales archaeon]
MKVAEFELRDRDEDYININPLQTAGKTYADTRKAIISYIDGYSVCDWCKGDLCSIEKPPVKKFLEDVSGFLGMDSTILTNGCREAKYSVLHTLTEHGDSVVVDGNKHYTTYVAAERAGLKIYEVKSSGHPEFKIEPEGYAEAFEKVKAETGRLPKVAVLTHVDGSYGNIVDSAKVSGICRDYGVPLLLNTAYSSGRMPVDGKKLGADFIACSCHKSWAAGGGNIGLLATTDEWSDNLFRQSTEYKVKTLEILGCSTRGSSTLALMASYPHVKERVKRWDTEVENARWLVDELERLGLKPLGVQPTEHDLNFVESDVLYEISQTHKKKNFYLYHELKRRGVVGVKAGLTKQFKFSTYGKSREQVEHLAWAFKDIIEKFG